MTRNEAKQEAVRDHRCPHCHAQPGFRCRQTALVRVKFLKSPHIERMKEVPEWAAELESRAAVASTST